MNDLTIRTAAPEDAYVLNLRPSDHHEGSLWVPGWDVQKVVASSIAYSAEAWAAEAGGQVIAVAGYCLREEHEVVPWLMCSEAVKEHRKALLRGARSVLRFLRTEFPDRTICNHLHRPNKEARAFIEALGFRVVPTPGSPEFDFFYLPPNVYRN